MGWCHGWGGDGAVDTVDGVRALLDDRWSGHPRRWLVAVVVVCAGCTGEEATPIDELPAATTTQVTTPHLLEPTEQMWELAEQQCRDDPALDEGVVEAVDPADPDEVLASVTVSCDEVRGASG